MILHSRRFFHLRARDNGISVVILEEAKQLLGAVTYIVVLAEIETELGVFAGEVQHGIYPYLLAGARSVTSGRNILFSQTGFGSYYGYTEYNIDRYLAFY